MERRRNHLRLGGGACGSVLITEMRLIRVNKQEPMFIYKYLSFPGKISHSESHRLNKIVPTLSGNLLKRGF